MPSDGSSRSWFDWWRKIRKQIQTDSGDTRIEMRGRNGERLQREAQRQQPPAVKLKVVRPPQKKQRATRSNRF